MQYLLLHLEVFAHAKNPTFICHVIVYDANLSDDLKIIIAGGIKLT